MKLPHLTGNGKTAKGDPAYFVSVAVRMSANPLFEFASVLMFLVWSQLFPVLCFWFVWFYVYVYIYIYVYVYLVSLYVSELLASSSCR